MEVSEDALFKVIDAAKAGHDILFGENHDVTSGTMHAISTLLDHVEADQVQAIVLELPIEMTEIFEKGAAESLGIQCFIRRAFEIQIAHNQRFQHASRPTMQRGSFSNV